MLCRFIVLIICMFIAGGCAKVSTEHTVHSSVSEEPLRLESNRILALKEETQRKYDEANRKAARYIKRAEDVYELEKNVEKEIIKINKVFDEKCLSIEEDYKVRIFNLKLQLDALRQKPSQRLELEAELDRVRCAREREIGALNTERDKLIAEQRALLGD